MLMLMATYRSLVVIDMNELSFMYTGSSFIDVMMGHLISVYYSSCSHCHFYSGCNDEYLRAYKVIIPTESETESEIKLKRKQFFDKETENDDNILEYVGILSLTHSLTHSFTRKVILSLTNSLSLIHSLAHSYEWMNSVVIV
jgi:hypothetical protein